ncbi:hypothetical protein JKP88DRAFT_263489 [Tribonema minus]|uniref:Uncharacterized protein n=1 Tax=Tribonema minus TaxID=303371 RepID=A0A835YXH1_9STRA|nr:hypothetical protein JKP88DRAFT_263489 [Tribonema minus]
MALLRQLGTGMLGARRFLQLYIAGGAFSNLCHAGMPLIARAYGGHVQDSLHCGADGPLLSIFGWFVSRNPAATVSLFGVVPLPAGLCGVGYLLYEAYTLQTQGVAPGTGSRMGAFASGVMYAFFTRGSIRRW